MEADCHQVDVPPNQGGVRSVTRAVGLLSALGSEGRSLTELAAAVGVSLSTASRLLSTLRMSGYVEQQGDSGLWVPGTALMSLFYATDRWAGIRDVASATVRLLRDELDETAAFFVMVGNERVCIESAESTRAVRRVVPPGERGPIYLGAAGKALLAFSPAPPQNLGLRDGVTTFETASGRTRSLEDLRAELQEVAKRGYASSSYESTREAWSIAAPARVDGNVVGAVATSVPGTRDEPEYVDEITAKTIATAAAIA